MHSAMEVALFDYGLPPELVSQEPLPERSASRMLVLPRWCEGPVTDTHFRHLPEHLCDRDCLVLNDSRVVPARLLTRRPSGGEVEVLLLRELAPHLWEALVRPGAKLREGACAVFGDGELAVEVLAVGARGMRTVRLEYEGDLWAILDEIGHTPLPPYIKRQAPRRADRARYQTVYASRPGAVAAPTAGLHFDRETLEAVGRKGVKIAFVTLDVGLGTFQPVRADEVEEHKMHAEWCEVSEESAAIISETRASGGRVVAVGTTVVRSLESRATDGGQVVRGSGLSDLFIYPGYQFRAVDALLTNFHLPRSTLLMMVCAFAGRERVLGAYRHAIAERYRFYSYGDCMLIM